MKTMMVNVKTKAMALLLLVVTLFSAVAPVAMPNSMFSPATASAADVLGDLNITANGNKGVNIDMGAGTGADAKGVIDRYRSIITIVFAVLTITMGVFLAINIAKLGAAGDNQMERKKAIGGILTTGVATALLGSFSVWFGFFYNAIRTA